MRYKFEGELAISKLFVCVAHFNGHAICLKATSKLDLYKSNSARMAGVVFLPAGSVSCFPADTVIQPDNQVPIPHPVIVTQHKQGTFAVVATLPAAFESQLAAAVNASETLEPREQKRLAQLLGW